MPADEEVDNQSIDSLYGDERTLLYQIPKPVENFIIAGAQICMYSAFLHHLNGIKCYKQPKCVDFLQVHV